MRILLSAIFIFISFFCEGQRSIDVNASDERAANSNFFFVVNGEPFMNAKFTRLVSGTPYFSDEWMKGKVTVNGGKEYSGLLFKLDLIDNVIHFQDTIGREMIASNLIQTLALFDTANQKIFSFVNSDFINAEKVQKGWYQLLVEGKKASFFKQIIKHVQEIKPYGSATFEQHISTSTLYWVLYDNKLTGVKKIKELGDLFTDKKTEILQYINQNNLSGKNDDDFVSVINFYNSTQQ